MKPRLMLATFVLGVAFGLLVGVTAPPEVIMALCAIAVGGSVLLLAIAAFHAAERSDGRG